MASLLVAALLLAAAVPAPAQRERRKEQPALPTPPPQPVPLAVKVPRGGKVEIPLRIYGSFGGSLSYVIRTPPVHGRLSEMRAAGKNAAVLTYEPPATLAITRDAFSYATQSSLGVSAAADVAITIVDEAPVLIVPDTIAFEPLLTGTTASREIEISNTGGGLAQGEVQVDPPWRIEGPASYRLAAGERQQVLLLFAPNAAGSFRREVRYTSHRDRTTLVRGEAQAAIAFEPASVEMRQEPGDPARRGSFQIVNHTAEQQKVTIAAPARLQAMSSVTVAAQGRAPITLETAPGDAAPLNEEVRLSGGGVELRVPVRGAATAPMLRPGTSLVDVGEVPASQVARGSLEVENVGGSEGFWRLDIPPPASAEPSEIRLAAGEKRRIALTVSASEPGFFSGMLRVRGEAQEFEIPVRALITSGPALRPVSASARSFQTLPRAARLRHEDTNDDPPPQSEDLPRMLPTGVPARVISARLVSVGRSKAVVEWPANASPAREFRLETRRLSLDANRQLKDEWVEHQAVRFRVADPNIRAEINGLQPGTGYVFRVVPISARGDSGAPRPLFSIAFQSTPKLRVADLFTLPRVLGTALVICLGLIGWRKYRDRT